MKTKTINPITHNILDTLLELSTLRATVQDQYPNIKDYYLSIARQQVILDKIQVADHSDPLSAAKEAITILREAYPDTKPSLILLSASEYIFGNDYTYLLD